MSTLTNFPRPYTHLFFALSAYWCYLPLLATYTLILAAAAAAADVITVIIIAPEYVNENKPCRESDVWSLVCHE